MHEALKFPVSLWKGKGEYFRTGRILLNFFNLVSFRLIVVNITEICDPGSTGYGRGCAECDADYYKPDEGRQNCTQCQEGYSTHNQTGQINCTGGY